MSDDGGFGDLGKQLEKAGRRIVPEVRKTVFKGAMNVKKRAENLAPAVHLADKISFEVTIDGDEVSADIQTVSPLGAVMEYGTPTNPGGRPFMLPAVRPEEPVLEEFVDKIVKDLLW